MKKQVDEQNVEGEDVIPENLAAGDIVPMGADEMQTVGDVIRSEHAEEALPAVDPSLLFRDQRRAYDIITSHLLSRLEGQRPDQLLMLIYGEGGTGKSEVVQNGNSGLSCGRKDYS